MKLEITQKGVFAPADKDSTSEREVPVGTVIEINGDVIPAALINKCREIGKPTEKAKPVTNPAQGSK